MKRTENIKKFWAAILLLIFTISVTPKKYFHDLFSAHTDYAFQHTSSGEKEINAYKFNCGLVNTIAVPPFIAEETVADTPLLFFAVQGPDKIEGPLFQSAFDIYLRRGPPAT
ncbi:MAG TPA: hypothetical protein PKE30_16045 [Niabella sp.]|nr:hypothetical protein [Niabella sp.]